MRLFARVIERTKEAIVGWLIDLDDNTKTLSLVAKSSLINDFEISCDRQIDKLAGTKFHDSGKCGFIIDQNKFKSVEEQVITLKLFEKNTNLEINISPIIVDKRNYHRRVLLVGFNKSGTSILAQRIAAGMANAKIYFEPKGKQGLLKFKTHLPFTARNNVVTKCLFYPEHASDVTQISNLYDKKIWIIRDPRDVLISIFFYKWKTKSTQVIHAFENTLRLVQQKEMNPASISFLSIAKEIIDPDHVLSAYKRIDQYLHRMDTSWHIIKYEDHVDGKNQQLNNYLGFDVSEETETKGNKYVKRSSSYGAWRDWFTHEDVQTLQPVLDPILLKFGYDERDWALRSPDQLDPTLGSEYMKLIFKD